MVKPGQFRAARALVGLGQAGLATASGLSVPTIKRLESGTGANVTERARNRVVRALETAGVIFIDENGEGPGVRLRKAPHV